MHFDVAISMILEHEKKSTKSSKPDEKLLASITHWLQNPETHPVYFDETKSKEWLNLLGYKKVSELVRSIDFSTIPIPPIKNPKFKFIDLFAGIGGFRISLQEADGHCVFSSEWNKGSQSTYFKNYGELPFGDIREFTSEKLTDKEIDNLIPDHDILAAGFPCQPFSLAGVSARESVGKMHGFDCEIQGTLFFDIVRIAKIKKPKVLLLENVRNLLSHDNGRTFEVIKKTIENDLGYSFSYSLLDSSSLVPQRRVRCYMVCYRNKKKVYDFPEITGTPLPLKSILDKKVPAKYTISDKLWAGHMKRTERNVARGTGFTAFTADLNKPSNTIVARYGKDGKECLIPQNDNNPRKLTPKECAKLFGFPVNFTLPQHDSPAYFQFGNSVVVPVLKEIVKRIEF